MTTDEKALGLGKLYEGVYPKSTLWKAYRNLNEIKKSLESACQLIIEVSQRREDSLISKILHGSKALCEENPDLVKGIIDTPKTSEEKIAEDFVENYLPENFVEDFLNNVKALVNSSVFYLRYNHTQNKRLHNAIQIGKFTYLPLSHHKF